ncbi:adenylyl-sulfate kinase 3 isoform X1 [Cryptomeria japonica]|uniref:adenylyl-sulfate kinase 3 isoform X1 n=1 Tax=Cryptomeria japonica TaxID=3369 RepID=UPI0027D9D3DA|nr:adenylyl-sulfate kinase 3 isoform X1 [Cryptomeria japonica]
MLACHSQLAVVRSTTFGCGVIPCSSSSNRKNCIKLKVGRRKNGVSFNRFSKLNIHYRMTVEGSSELRGDGHDGREEKTLTLNPNAVDVNTAQSSIPGATCSPGTVGKATNIVWQECPVNKESRQKLLGQKSCVIWITGLSGSGKSTLACAVSQILHSRGKLSYLLDGDNVRHGLNKNLGFSAEDRAENIRRIGEVAKLFVDAGIICIASFISPYRKDRDTCRALLPAGEFIEIFMNFPLHICEERDVKGLYKLARAGKIKGFTGIDDPYEPPENCEIVMESINGVCPAPKDMAEKVVAYLEENDFLQA